MQYKRTQAVYAPGPATPRELSDLPRFGCCLSESTHDILSGNHAYQLPLGRHYGETSHLEANHQLEDPR